MDTETITLTVEVSYGYADLVYDRLYSAAMQTRNALRDYEAPVRDVTVHYNSQTARLTP